jgi:dCTP deaminase
LILTDREIQIAIDRGIIVIDPPPQERAFSSTSVDLTLDATLSEYKENPPGIETAVDPGHQAFDHEATLAQLTTQLTIPDGGYLFNPGRFVLAWTREYINLITHARLVRGSRERVPSRALGSLCTLPPPSSTRVLMVASGLRWSTTASFPSGFGPACEFCQLVFEQTLGTPERGYKGRFSGQSAAKKG